MGKTMGKLLMGVAFGALAFSPVAHATVTAMTTAAENTATFDNNAVGSTSGTSFVCDSAYCGAISFTATGAGVVNTTTGNYAEPLNNTSHYIYGLGTGDDITTVTFAHATNSFNINWGSIDSIAGDGYDNILTLFTTMGNDILTGTQLAAMVGAPGNGSQTDAMNNLWLNISSSMGQVTGFSASSSSPAFEFDMGANAVPEPSTWAMMGLGFAGLAYAAFRRNSKTARVAIG